jgi:predicted nucleotidyltransferase
MKQFDAIQSIVQAILADGFVDALFLKGSIARNENDEYSDVDLYAAVNVSNMERFLGKRLLYLQAYLPLVYWTEVNFGCAQIIGVYENALHFDLITVNTDNIPQTDDIEIIYDKNGVMTSYEKEPLKLSDGAIINEINSFSFRLLEFEIFYSRRDYIWATRLIYAQMFHVSKLLWFVFDKENAQLGAKRLFKYLPDDLYDEHVRIMELSTPSNLFLAKNAILQLMDKTIAMLPVNIQEEMNHDFYDLMHDRILKLIEQ